MVACGYCHKKIAGRDAGGAVPYGAAPLHTVFHCGGACYMCAKISSSSSLE